jgi:DNA processing protein
VNDRLTDEAYARAALTYLVEPADRWLGQLLREHGAAVTLDAIKAGGLPGDPAALPAGPGLPADPDHPDNADHPEGPGRRDGPGHPGHPDHRDEPGHPGDRDHHDGPDRGGWPDHSGGPGHGGDRGDQGSRSTRVRQARRAALERWQVRLPLLPSPDEILARRESGIRLIIPQDPEWPGQLADLGDAQPYALWLRGHADLRFCCLRSVAIVGSRAASAYGSYLGSEFAASLAARGFAVVSGGAFGIDAAAHRGALGADGVTVAVLACGVDTPYPAAHAELFDAIAAQGVVVSEWPPGTHVSRLRFLIRNRVIAALATGTLVVEAARRSGAVNTARHARDLHRRVMAIPGPVTSDLSAGCHDILRDWAGTLVTTAADVAEHLSPAGVSLSGPLAWPGDPVQPGDLVRPGNPASPGNPVRPGDAARPGGPALPRDLLDLDSARVLDAMPRRGGAGTLRLAQRAALTPATTAMCLGGLAAAGFVERCDDGWRLRRA